MRVDGGSKDVLLLLVKTGMLVFEHKQLWKVGKSFFKIDPSKRENGYQGRRLKMSEQLIESRKALTKISAGTMVVATGSKISSQLFSPGVFPRAR